MHLEAVCYETALSKMMNMVVYSCFSFFLRNENIAQASHHKSLRSFHLKSSWGSDLKNPEWPPPHVIFPRNPPPPQTHIE